MKGLFYCDWFEEYTAALVLSVAETHGVTLIVRESSEEFRGRRSDEAEFHRNLRDAGIDVHLLSGKYWTPQSWLKVLKIVGPVRRYDYFHVQQTGDPRFLWIALRRPTVYTMHEPAARHGLTDRFSVRNVSAATVRRLYRFFANRIVVHTQSGLEGLSPREARKAVVIPHGVHPSLARPSDGSKTILFFGRAVAYKGIEILLAAMTEVWKVEPDAELQILASPGDGECQYETPDSRISASWNGYSAADLQLALSNARAVCLPYTSVSGSGVGAQAYGSGKPIIASNLEGLCELVSHKELLVEPGDVDDLARALILALNQDYGLQEIDPVRTWPRVAQAHIAAYQAIVGNDQMELQPKR
jgi:glycosyltransferase involved in cell wall biosynthesis